MTVRAKVWATRSPAFHHRGISVKPHWTWHYAVYLPNGKVVLYDNTGYWEPMFWHAFVRVEALRHMQTAGHKLKQYENMEV